MQEFDFINALRKLPLHSGARGLDDDCAVLEVGGETLILTHDAMAEGTHYRPGADMADVAWKLVATNLSDLAAKGAEPIGVLLGHSLGADDAQFLDGLNEVLTKYDTPLLGGDTVASSNPPTLGLTAIGRATHTPVPSRSGARAGDAIYVTGMLGAAMLGFEGAPEHLAAFNRPVPLLSEGQALAPQVTAIMDVSDGLLLDAWRMAKASSVCFQLESAMIPVANNERLNECIRWGDDYQLLFTADPSAHLPVPASRIGTVEAADTPVIYLDGALLGPEDGLGYSHANST